MVEANSLLLDGCPLFKSVLSPCLKTKLVKAIQTLVIQPENIIDLSKLVQEGQSGIFMCFIETGGVEIFYQSENS